MRLGRLLPVTTAVAAVFTLTRGTLATTSCPAAAAAAAAASSTLHTRAFASNTNSGFISSFLSRMGEIMSRPSQLPTKEQALPGRSDEMEISAKHFVLKNPMRGPWPEGHERVVFATGCFWGAEKCFWQLPGVYSTAVGYINGMTPNPTYKEVCSGMTGHTEGVQVVYDPKVIRFVDLLKPFWESHNPTQGMRQGPDQGTQYRSGIYTTTPDQTLFAEASKKAYEDVLKAAGHAGPITTEIVDTNPVFYYAEDYHQQYIDKPGNRKYCGADPTSIALPPPEAWGVPADKIPPPAQATEKIWSTAYDHCVL